MIDKIKIEIFASAKIKEKIEKLIIFNILQKEQLNDILTVTLCLHK